MHISAFVLNSQSQKDFFFCFLILFVSNAHTSVCAAFHSLLLALGLKKCMYDEHISFERLAHPTHSMACQRLEHQFKEM